MQHVENIKWAIKHMVRVMKYVQYFVRYADNTISQASRTGTVTHNNFYYGSTVACSSAY